MKNERYLNNCELFGKMWCEICAQNSDLETKRDLVRWSMESFQIFDFINDGIAILTSDQEIIWSNQQFKLWFPKASDPDLEINVLDALDGLQTIQDDNASPAYADPFAEFQATGETAKGVIQTKKGNFFEITVHSWNLQGCDEPLIFLLVHDATERLELRNKLKNLHQMCDMFSQRDFLKHQKDSEARKKFIIDGIHHMAKRLLHYEFLEVRMYEPASNTLPLCTHYGLLKEAEHRVIHAEPTGNGTIGLVASTKQAYICQDTETDPHYLRGGETARSSMTVPILFQEDLIGIINAESSQPNSFKKSDQLYAEIFAHEIALALNFMHALADEQSIGRKMTVEEIHGKIALPVKEIIDSTVKLEKTLNEEQIDAQLALHQIAQNVEILYKIIQEVGQQLPTIDSPANPGPQAFVEKWIGEFSGKSILLIDSSDEVFSQGLEIFTYLNCNLDWATTGHEAIRKLKSAEENGTPYYAILASFVLKDYRLGTQFFLDLSKIYGTKHPPLVILQELNVYDVGHTVTNVRRRYPGSGHVGKPFTVPLLLNGIHDAVIKCEKTPPYFSDLGKDYDDPMKGYYS